MATRSISPGGALLRASRVFSIPPPLPQPKGDLSSQAIFHSDSATTPHPLHLSITTPRSSRMKGDWGFKRSLPLRKTTKSSTPFLRVKAIDTWEHITEFGSSADHTLTLQKWQEMGIPLTVPVVDSARSTFSHGQRLSVFEERIDSTIEQQSETELAPEDTRWKFTGPWLAGQTEGDFNTYVTTDVRKKRLGFREYLGQQLAKSLTQEARRKADAEEPATAIEAEEITEITEQQITEFIKALRRKRADLFKHIRAFLDLPPAPTKATDLYMDTLTGTFGDIGTKPSGSTLLAAGAAKDIVQSQSPYADTGPPKTHPSAGLSYIRSSNYIFNHPEFGPQRLKAPVKSRVIMPKAAATGNFAPVLGVGGFVADVPDGHTSFRVRTAGIKGSGGYLDTQVGGLLQVEPDKVGGSKTYVHPVHARVDPNGRVIMKINAGDAEAVAVLEGTTAEIPTPAGANLAGPGSVARSTGFTPSEAKSYGLHSISDA